jgi:ribonuclease E
MSSNTKMLIDATHPEETRVVVQRNGRVEEFDFESAARKLLRGNIYLAKVTRVEPSLQAAFVDYGGNRHGFLAFNEIHPDYYQIPVADRQALIDEEAAAEAELEAAADRRAEALARRAQGRRPDQPASAADAPLDNDDLADDAGDIEPGSEASHIIDVEEDEHIEEVGGDLADSVAPQTYVATVERNADVISEDISPRESVDIERESLKGPDTVEAGTFDLPHIHHEAEDDEDEDEAEGLGDPAEDASGETGDADDIDDEQTPDGTGGDAGPDAHTAQPSARRGRGRGRQSEGRSQDDSSDSHGGEFHEEAPARQRRRPRSYKIQEVIKRRQVILVQVVKEERGNKGAALTTYLSLAGRYTVLMPNTARGGGISRKITNPQDRKRLKAIANELEVPEGMGLIIRTAGAARTKQEIKRDFEYLLRLWESVRDLTLQSTAPALVYEEGDLIKRSIRDLYNKDVEEVVVAGDAGYEEAAAFMHMLMPSHSKHVVPYKNPTPLFTSYGVERQLNAMFLPQVTLRSGGYIVINQTEALVAIDVNSGKSTREFSIEETALATNLEAADEIARQLKLRDLAGLIVIDFIDMEEKRNNRAVERRLKDALRFDRARIQLGRISHFGLMEMSRQRLRTGVLEGSTSQCPHCQGTGIIRSTESIALAVLRGLEDSITAGANTPLIATTTPTVALYILNSKRAYVTDMEQRHGYPVTIIGSDRIQGANFTVDRGAPSALPVRRPERAAVNMDWGFEGEGDEEAPAYQGAEIEMVGDDEDGDEGAERQSRSEGRPEARGESRGEGDDDGNRKGRRRRRRGRGRGQRGERGEEGDRNGNRPGRDPAPAYAEGDARNEMPMDDTSNGHGESDIDDNDSDSQVERTVRADHPEGSREDEGRNDRPGRRRRRGRRGGRRGRDGNRETITGQEGNGRDGDGAPADLANPALSTQPGLGDQPRFNDAPISGGGRSAARDREATQNVSGHSERPRPERKWPERIWDLPTAASNDGPSTATSSAEPVGHDTAPVTSNVAPQERAAPFPKPPAPAAMATPLETTSTEAAPLRRRHETDSSEPRIERVVVRPDQVSDQPAAADEEASSQPQRKGWWQRRFGGE